MYIVSVVLISLVTLYALFHGIYIYRETFSFQSPPASLGLQHNEGSVGPSLKSSEKAHQDEEVIGAELDKLFYFVQISDLHISHYHDYQRHFFQFLAKLPDISPAFVIVTGDLTDAKDVHKITSFQHLDEWKLYRDSLEKLGLWRRDYWHDLKGNHDSFNIPDENSVENYYQSYGVSGGRGWAFDVQKSWGKYGFIGIDASPKRGPSRPFNFFGYLDTADMDNLASRLDAFRHYNHTFLFAHYPSTTLLFGHTSTGKSFRQDLSRLISAYMCGHLHRLFFGLGNNLLAYQPSGYLELELADMKEHGVFRVMALDHDLVSFVDVEMPPPIDPGAVKSVKASEEAAAPTVLITNPKDARFLMEDREPTGKIRKSTHIRVLVWPANKASVKEVVMEIDGKFYVNAEYRGRGKPFTLPLDAALRPDSDDAYLPLWVAPWDPTKLDDGREHVLVVRAYDALGREGRSEIYFRVDGKRAPIARPFSGEWIIRSNFALAFRVLFYVVYSTLISLLIVPRTMVGVWGYRGTKERNFALLQTSIRTSRGWISSFVLECWWRLLQLAQSPDIFYPFWVYLLCLVALPWFHGQFIRPLPEEASRIPGGGKGLFYIYGLWIGGEWLPLPDTWYYATLYLIFLFPWLLWFLLVVGENEGIHTKIWARMSVAAFWVWRASGIWMLARCYGIWPVLPTSIQTWWHLALGIMLLRKGLLTRNKDGLYQSAEEDVEGRKSIAYEEERGPHEEDPIRRYNGVGGLRNRH
ncbi:uncharacterized protein VTP21DRAFT_6723 [Calcarisporiella thermophila]|uniref:uncharacterized protein n=1 Tax=Calcarisporiella thermophila TaxID=911321 RepID=UPI003741FA05